MPRLHPAVRDDAERNALAVQNLGLVIWCLKRLCHRPAVRRYRDECRGAGYLALLRAAALWDADGGARFPRYAVRCVTGAILREAGACAGGPRAVCFDDRFDRPKPRKGFRLDPDDLARALGRLKPRHGEVLILRFGLLGRPRRRLREIAAEWGVTRQGVHVVLRTALRRLARELAALGALPPDA
jgi:RNA polymerase sigma factor (sigma-70 family)